MSKRRPINNFPYHKKRQARCNNRKKPNTQCARKENAAQKCHQPHHRRVVEITPSKVFAEEMIIGLVLVDFGEEALQNVDNEPNEKATTKAEFPIEFVLCHGHSRL